MQLSRIQGQVLQLSGSAQIRLYISDFCLCPDTKVIYRRYASLFFIIGTAANDNELINLEIVHRYVEQMDKYFGNVCELDIIFEFKKAYFILNELLLAGEMQESSKKNILKCIHSQDSLEDMEVSCFPFILLSFSYPRPSPGLFFLSRMDFAPTIQSFQMLFSLHLEYAYGFVVPPFIFAIPVPSLLEIIARSCQKLYLLGFYSYRAYNEVYTISIPANLVSSA